MNDFFNDALAHVEIDVEQIDSKIVEILSATKNLMSSCFKEHTNQATKTSKNEVDFTSTASAAFDTMKGDCQKDLSILKDQLTDFISFVSHLGDDVNQPDGMVKKALAQNADLAEVKALSKGTKKALIKRERDIVHAQAAKDSKSSNKEPKSTNKESMISKLNSDINQIEKEENEKIDEFEKKIDEKLQMLREKLDKKILSSKGMSSEELRKSVLNELNEIKSEFERVQSQVGKDFTKDYQKVAAKVGKVIKTLPMGSENETTEQDVITVTPNGTEETETITVEPKQLAQKSFGKEPKNTFKQLDNHYEKRTVSTNDH